MVSLVGGVGLGFGGGGGEEFFEEVHYFMGRIDYNLYRTKLYDGYIISKMVT